MFASTENSGELYDLVITGGTVVLPAGPQRINIGVRDGLIAWIGAGAAKGHTVLDASGRLVLPGGVDSHCHLDQQPWQGRSIARRFSQRNAVGALRRQYHRAAVCHADARTVPARNRR
jgi:N-acyl-D-aspartate/D-glutamate deacylase